jgi:hypothetical protein
MQISKQRLRFLCEVISYGIAYGTGTNQYDIIHTRIVAVLSALGGAREDEYYIRDLENQISDHYRVLNRYQFVDAKLADTGSEDRGDKVAADTCSPVSAQRTPCKDYEDLKHTQRYRNIVTYATKLDPGFNVHHVDYTYCNQGLDYMTGDCSVILKLNGQAFSHVQYIKQTRGDTIQYKDMSAIGLMSGWKPALRLKREEVLAKMEDVYIAWRDDQRDPEIPDRMKKVFYFLMNRFHGDLAQILYTRAVSEQQYLGVGENNKLYMLTSDRMMTLVSVVIVGYPIYTSIHGQLKIMVPEDDPTVVFTAQSVEKIEKK